MKLELGAFFVFVAWLAVAFNLLLAPSLARIGYLVGFYAVGAAIFWGWAKWKSRRDRSASAN